MTNSDDAQTIRAELETGVQLAKCRKCGCIKETLDNLTSLLPTLDTDEAMYQAKQMGKNRVSASNISQPDIP